MYFYVEYILITRVNIFWSVLQFYLALLVLLDVIVGVSVLDSFEEMSIMMIFGASISYMCVDQVILMNHLKIVQTFIEETVIGKS